MSNEISGISAKLQKIIDLGMIDSWMRGLRDVVPSSSNTPPDFNRHVLAYGSHEDIREHDMTAMVGFRQLIAACSKNNICVHIDSLPEGHIRIEFKPDLKFSSSRVFGVSYTNVLPTIFGKRHDGMGQ